MDRIKSGHQPDGSFVHTSGLARLAAAGLAMTRALMDVEKNGIQVDGLRDRLLAEALMTGVMLPDETGKHILTSEAHEGRATLTNFRTAPNRRKK